MCLGQREQRVISTRQDDGFCERARLRQDVFSKAVRSCNLRLVEHGVLASLLLCHQ